LRLQRAEAAARRMHFGENYVAEAEIKTAATADLADVQWHMIGHLQRNKAGRAVRLFDLIHSLDSVALAAALSRASSGRRIPVLIEVNIGAEPSKNGVSPDAVEGLIASVREMVDVRGLMAIPPVTDVKGARRFFAAMRALRDRVAGATGIPLGELSMGMSEDFELAIEEGATIVRIGRAIFGERPLKR
jgi:pyridoxal phosphate enzyme (YggS family)